MIADPYRQARSPELPPALNVRRLLLIRSIAIPGAAVALAVLGPAYGLVVSIPVVVGIALALLGLNGFLWWRVARGFAVSNRALFLELMLDLLALTVIIALSGGPANPLVLFFLLPLTIAAAILPQRYAWSMGAASAICYTGLLLYTHFVPRGTASHAMTAAPELHTTGMWLGFVLIAALVAHFVAAMAETLRQRDRDLALAREAALRDEQVLAVATLAAGAAHELSTPLATMAVVAGELAMQYPEPDHPDLARQLGVLREQISRCKDALSVLSASAGAARADRVEQLTPAQFVGRAVDEVHRLRPGACVLIQPDDGGGPPLALDRRAYQALLNVLNNAVDASPASVSVACHFDPGALEITVADRGKAAAREAGERFPRPGHSTKPGGLGLGLLISRAALAQLGGELLSEANADGGTTVRLRLATNRLTEASA
jgi:two-component system sensor histidine kinase RegB